MRARESRANGWVFLGVAVGCLFGLAVSASPLQAQQWRFEPLPLENYITDPDAMNGECAIVDVTGDGHPDLWWSVYAFQNSKSDKARYEKQKDLYQMAWYKGPDFKQMFRMHKGFTHGGNWRDMNGDGRPDLVTGLAIHSRELVWLENPGRPEQTRAWPVHPIHKGDIDPDFAYDAQSVVVDLDKDGRTDVILASEEGFDGVAWYSWDTSQKKWIKHQVAPAKSYSGLHSLRVADFDRDGDLDIFTAEMHTSGYIKQVPPHKVAVWENVDIEKNQWKEHVVAETGSHNARVGDINGDGYPDIIGSNWNNRIKEYPLRPDAWINRIGR